MNYTKTMVSEEFNLSEKIFIRDTIKYILQGDEENKRSWKDCSNCTQYKTTIGGSYCIHYPDRIRLQKVTEGCKKYKASKRYEK